MLKGHRDRVNRPEGMVRSEIDVMCGLVVKRNLKKLLEVGMAHGSSTVALLSALNSVGGGTLTSIDPYQLITADSPQTPGYGGKGIANVEKTGLGHMHTLLAEPDYIALPKLVATGEKFDFVFIDGYHSFDYTFLDFFYADLLLRVGGVVSFHDSAFPGIYSVCRFVMRNKAYSIVGPRPEVVYKDPLRKIFRRARYLLSGRNEAFRKRRQEWRSFAAFQKDGEVRCKEYVMPKW